MNFHDKDISSGRKCNTWVWRMNDFDSNYELRALMERNDLLEKENERAEDDSFHEKHMSQKVRIGHQNLADNEVQLEATKKQIVWSVVYLIVGFIIATPYLQGRAKHLHGSSTTDTNYAFIEEDVLYTYEQREWNINKSMFDIWRPQMPEFVQCLEAPVDLMEKGVERNYPPGSLTVVQSISNGYQDDEFDYATSMMACYCSKYDCKAHQNSVDLSKYPDHKSFFSARWRSIKERFWNTSEWVFGMDTDLVPINFDKDVKEYIKNVSDHASIILHARRNREIVASPLGFKTHDKFANCFFERFNI